MISKDEIIRMAREAGFYDGREDLFWVGEDGLQRFASLVAAHTQEQCAKVCEEESKEFDSLADGAHDGRYDWKSDGAMDCAAAIRAMK
jgi:hypothetical protein